jgi:hypothetical protein
MKKRNIFVLFLLLVLRSPAIVQAEGDSITLKNGKVLEGHIAAWNDGRTEIYFSPADPKTEARWMPLSEIESIHFAGVQPKSKRSAVQPK